MKRFMVLSALVLLAAPGVVQGATTYYVKEVTDYGYRINYGDPQSQACRKPFTDPARAQVLAAEIKAKRPTSTVTVEPWTGVTLRCKNPPPPSPATP